MIFFLILYLIKLSYNLPKKSYFGCTKSSRGSSANYKMYYLKTSLFYEKNTTFFLVIIRYNH